MWAPRRFGNLLQAENPQGLSKMSNYARCSSQNGEIRGSIPTMTNRTPGKLLPALFCIAASLASIGLRAQEAPDVLVKTVTLEVIDLLAKDNEIKSGSRAKLMKLIDAKVLPHFNFTAMTG